MRVSDVLQNDQMLAPFVEQVAGHQNTIMTLGQDKRKVCKPMSERELKLYQHTFNSRKRATDTRKRGSVCVCE